MDRKILIVGGVAGGASAAMAQLRYNKPLEHANGGLTKWKMKCL